MHSLICIDGALIGKKRQRGDWIGKAVGEESGRLPKGQSAVPLYQVSCRLLSLWLCKYSARFTPFRPCQSASRAGPTGCGSEVISGTAFACAGPIRPRCPLPACGPWACGACGYRSCLGSAVLLAGVWFGPQWPDFHPLLGAGHSDQRDASDIPSSSSCTSGLCSTSSQVSSKPHGRSQ